MDALHLQGAKIRGKISTITRSLENVQVKLAKMESQSLHSNRNDEYEDMKTQEVRKARHKTPYVAHNNLLKIENIELKRVCERLSKENQRKDRIIIENKEEISIQKALSSRKLREIEEERQEYIMFDQYLNAVKTESELLKEVVQKLQCSFAENKEELSKLYDARNTIASLVDDYTAEISSLKESLLSKDQSLQEMVNKIDKEVADNVQIVNNHKFCSEKLQEASKQQTRLKENLENVSRQLLAEQAQNKIYSKIIQENEVREQLVQENQKSMLISRKSNTTASMHNEEKLKSHEVPTDSDAVSPEAILEQSGPVSKSALTPTILEYNDKEMSVDGAVHAKVIEVEKASPNAIENTITTLPQLHNTFPPSSSANSSHIVKSSIANVATSAVNRVLQMMQMLVDPDGDEDNISLITTMPNGNPQDGVDKKRRHNEIETNVNNIAVTMNTKCIHNHVSNRQMNNDIECDNTCAECHEGIYGLMISCTTCSKYLVHSSCAKQIGHKYVVGQPFKCPNCQDLRPHK